MKYRNRLIEDKIKDGCLYPIEIKSKSNLTGFDSRGLKSFRETYGEKVKPGLIIYTGKECYKLNKTDTAVPWNSLFQ